jgi:hypothetical protein
MSKRPIFKENLGTKAVQFLSYEKMIRTKHVLPNLYSSMKDLH